AARGTETEIAMIPTVVSAAPMEAYRRIDVLSCWTVRPRRLGVCQKMPYCGGSGMASSATRVVSAEGPLLQQILDATFPIWHEGLTRQAYGKWWDAQRRTAWGHDRLKRFALVEGDRVLASAKEYHLTAVIDGKPEPVLGIGAGFTPPADRGRGYARELIEQLIDRTDAGAALLFSEIGPDYYRRLGFEAIPAREFILRVDARGGGAPAMLVRAGDRRDLAAMAAMGRVRA